MSSESVETNDGLSMWAYARRERPPELGDFGVTIWTFASMLASCRGLEPEMRARLVAGNKLRIAMVNLACAAGVSS